MAGNVGGWIGLAVLAYVMVKCSSSSDTEPRAAVAAPIESPAITAAKARQEIAFRKVVMVMKELKSAQRQPESLVWEEIYGEQDASVMCFKYRSKNGFGGMNKNILVIANKKASDKVPVWNKHCSGKGFEDFKHAVHAL